MAPGPVHYKGDDYLYTEYGRPKDDWKLTRTWWPKTCCSSNQPIPMFTRAYVCKEPVDSPCRSIIVHERWLTESEYLVKKLKGEV